MTFRIGQKIECISTKHVETPDLVCGHVYTVHGICTKHGDGLGLFLSEVNPGPHRCCFGPWLFRPLTDISVFTKMLTDTKVSA